MITPNDPKFYEEFWNCKICKDPYYFSDLINKVERPVFDFGHPDPSYIIVGMNPGKDEVKHGRPFVGPAGKVLVDTKNNSGLMIEAQKIWQDKNRSKDTPLDRGMFTNLARCQFRDGESNRTPTDVEYKNCRPIFDKMWRFLKPRIVLACGADVINQLGIHDSMKNCVGAVYDMEYLDVKYKMIPCYHPSYYMRIQNHNNDNSKTVKDKIIQCLLKTIDLVIEYEQNKQVAVQEADDRTNGSGSQGNIQDVSLDTSPRYIKNYPV